MASPPKDKPFNPTEARRILNILHQPAVFRNMTSDWPVCGWSVDHLSASLGDKPIRFRLGRKDESNTPLFETQCAYIEATLGQFLTWTSSPSGSDVGSFADYPYSEYWAYADYKYIALLFQETPSKFEDIMWSNFGFEGRDGKASTLWIGTQGANTPCHLDSYGFNLVLQVQGRKRWHLFPPEDAASLYPTRIPYEESSIFSQVDVLRPDLDRFPAFRMARAHRVTLLPGQVLYVPRHWWHYVESLDPITVSVNTWIELEVDDEARVGEAVTKAVVCALKGAHCLDNSDKWLNPTEEGVATHEENMQYLDLAVLAYMQRQTTCGSANQACDPTGASQAKHDSGRKRTGTAALLENTAPVTASFGPHLLLVPCEPKHPPKDNDIGFSRSCAMESQTHQLVDPPKDCSPGSDQFKPAKGTGEDSSAQSMAEGIGHAPITTNDLLDCLVHPDVITHVTQLLLERRRGRSRQITPYNL